MKSQQEHGNGTSTLNPEAFTTQTIEDNPYLQSGDENGGSTEVHETATEEEFGAPSEKEDRLAKVKRRRRRFALAFIAGCLFLAVALALLLYRRMSTRVEYGTSRQVEVLPPAPSSTQGGPDSRTEKAIAEAKRLTEKSDNKASEESPSPSRSKELQESPFSFPAGSLSPNLNTTHDRSNDTSTSNETSASEPKIAGHQSAQPVAIQSQRSSETSLYMVESSVPVSSNKAATKPPITSIKKEEFKSEQVTLPTFGSMLPVQTVGSLFTLRAGALVRLQVTRDVTANGWSMKRGTILVGTTKGSEFDRAFVSLVGFIDPQTNKLVKLDGDLLGGDGAQGLKGKRRQIDAGWTRVLSRLVTSGAEVAGAFLSGRNQDTVIISDGVRTRTVNPISDEISGVVGNELERDKSRSFVEILAGTPGYVLVTDLPSETKGTESVPEKSYLDVETPRASTGLSERELADLLANGSREQIMAAIPKMTPEMRKIAEAVLRP